MKAKLEDVCAWFQEKKNAFVTHMRGFEKAENIIQSEMAVIDVGVIISILLGMSSNSQEKSRALSNAAKRALADCKMEDMICEAYNRENESLRVSQNGFCLVMRCELVYDNPVLNHRGFIAYLQNSGRRHQLWPRLLTLSGSNLLRVQWLLRAQRYP
jgi:hypothetical protein